MRRPISRRAFRHRYVHDVHNADAAHYERNAGYAGKQRGHQVGGGIQHGAEFLLAANGEVVVVTLLQLVVAAQYLGDFAGGIVRHVLGEGGGEDAAKIGRSVPAGVSSRCCKGQALRRPGPCPWSCSLWTSARPPRGRALG